MMQVGDASGFDGDMERASTKSALAFGRNSAADARLWAAGHSSGSRRGRAPAVAAPDWADESRHAQRCPRRAQFLAVNSKMWDGPRL
jgi:hypothetical protein